MKASSEPTVSVLLTAVSLLLSLAYGCSAEQPRDPVSLLDRNKTHSADRFTYVRAKEQHKLELSSPATALAFSPDGRLIAVAERSGQIALWDTATGKQDSILSRDPASIGRLSFSPQGERLLCSGRDQDRNACSIIWNVKSGKEEMKFKGLGAAFTSDGKSVALSQGKFTRIIELATRKVRLSLSNNDAEVPIDFSSDGTVLLTASGSDRGGYRSFTLWEVKKGEQLCHVGRTSNAAIRAFHLSTDGKEILPFSKRATAFGPVPVLQVFDTSTGKPLRVLPYPGMRLNAYPVAFSIDGRFVVVGFSNKVKTTLKAVDSGKIVLTLDDSKFKTKHNHDWANLLVFSTDGMNIAASYTGSSVVILWALSTQ